ncbi:MAG TPA: hypothetical protein VLY45_07415 [Nitrospiria bacterium]|nr:hypothetical protein [Nitrospiria bacterium]
MPSQLELIGFGFTTLCLALAVYSGMKAFVANSKLISYLKQNHNAQWHKFLGEEIPNLIQHIYLTPLNSEQSYFHFIFNSREDFGDQQIWKYKKQIRYRISGFIVYAIAGIIGFGMIGLVLSQLNP